MVIDFDLPLLTFEWPFLAFYIFPKYFDAIKGHQDIKTHNFDIATSKTVFP